MGRDGAEFEGSNSLSPESLATLGVGPTTESLSHRKLPGQGALRHPPADPGVTYCEAGVGVGQHGGLEGPLCPQPPHHRREAGGGAAGWVAAS